MKFRLEATPAELWHKGTALIEELVKAFSGVNDDLADSLEKALPPKEQDLKYPVLQKLRSITTKEYEATLKRMLADIGKVLDQSVSGTKAGSTELAKAEKLTKQEDEEEKLEPGDVDPETGELIPEPEDEEEEEEGEEEEKGLEKAAPGGVERAYKVRGHPEVIDQLDALLLIANKLGSWGASRNVTISMDGDGPHFLEVEGAEGELAKQALEGHIDKDEIKAYTVKLEKPPTKAEIQKSLEKLREDWEEVQAKYDNHTFPVPAFHVPPFQKAEVPQSEPLEHDFTKPIAEKDARAYERVKSILIGRGYKKADFEKGGELYGMSVNELIDLIRGKKTS